MQIVRASLPVRVGAGSHTTDIREQDNRFVAGCQNGDAADWEALVKRHTSRVYGLCYRFTRRHSDAQDLTQEVFIRVFRTLGGFRADEFSFVAWLNTVTRNLLVDHYRSVRNERLTVSISERPARFKGIGSSHRPDRLALARETSQILHGALTRLSPDLRETVSRYDVLGMTYHEISAELGIPIGTVKSRLHRARTVLARLLRGYQLAA